MPAYLSPPPSWLVAALLALGAVVWGIVYLLRIAPVGAGYKAKAVCSALFVSGRDLAAILAEDVSADSYLILRMFRTRVDMDARTVTCSLLGLRPRTAAYREGLGCTLASTAPGDLSPKSLPRAAAPSGSSRPWPDGDAAPEEPSGRLADIIERAFTEPDPKKLRRTRALIIAHKGRVAAERYAAGFSERTPLPGWSMTKGVTGTLTGILVGKGKLSLGRKELLPEWRGAGDPRRDIALSDLLRMRSGLSFQEIYTDPLKDVTRMLFACPDAAGFAAAKPLSAPPGTRWQYSSGTSNILSRIIREAVDGSHEDYLMFPRRALFDKIGMTSAVMEPNAAGDFVGSSFMFATARDWARLGLLYLRDGVWDGERILPDDWVRYSTEPTPQSPDGRYGAHWWLKIPPELGGETEAARRVPADAFFAIGHEGQVLTVIPSRDLVVVRLGLSVIIDAWDHAAFLASVLDALPSA